MKSTTLDTMLSHLLPSRTYTIYVIAYSPP